MRLAKALSAIGFLLMAFLVIRAILTGDFNAEGADLVRGPWGQLSLVDVYVGFLIVAGWIIFFLALQRSGGDWRKFWFGRRAASA